MKSINLLKRAAACVACLGMMLPQATMAGGTAPTQNGAKAKIADVSLANGVLNGKVINAQGKLLNGSVIKISQSNKVVARVVADKNGDFKVANLHSGVYQVSTGQTEAAVRLWEGQAAPPAAKKNILLVSGPLTRAQRETGLSPAMLGVGALATTAIVLSGVALADDGETTVVSP